MVFETGREQEQAWGETLISSNHKSEQARQEALNWLIALQDEPDDRDTSARFDAWLKESVENAQAWAEAQHVWTALGDARDKAVNKSSRIKPRAAREKRFHKVRFAAFAVITAAICLVLLLQPAINIWLHADYQTATAETRQIRLEDGSNVYLGADSAIDIAFTAQGRNVALLSGEAYFEVEPDQARPFMVDANGVETRVLGTGFNVSMTNDGVAVAVNHGRVSVAAPQMTASVEKPLEAGDWVRVGFHGQIERGKDAPELAGGWRNGILVVKNQRVGDVIDDIRRHYKGTILIADRTIAAQHVTGVYDLKNPADALLAVVQAHGAQIRHIGPWIMLVSRP